MFAELGNMIMMIMILLTHQACHGAGEELPGGGQAPLPQPGLAGGAPHLH